MAGSSTFILTQDACTNVEKLIALKSGGKSENYQVPRSISLTVASDQLLSCPVVVYSEKDGKEKNVELSAFIPSSNPSSIDLYCDGALVHQFSMENDDKILGIQLLPLPTRKSVIGKEHAPMAGVMLLVASINKGISIYSILLHRPKGSEEFRKLECVEVPSCSEAVLLNRRVKTMRATIVKQENNRAFLLVAFTRIAKDGSNSDERVAIMRYSLPKHKCPLFQWNEDDSSSPRVVAVGGKPWNCLFYPHNFVFLV